MFNCHYHHHHHHSRPWLLSLLLLWADVTERELQICECWLEWSFIDPQLSVFVSHHLSCENGQMVNKIGEKKQKKKQIMLTTRCVWIKIMSEMSQKPVGITNSLQMIWTNMPHIHYIRSVAQFAWPRSMHKVWLSRFCCEIQNMNGRCRGRAADTNCHLTTNPEDPIPINRLQWLSTLK